MIKYLIATVLGLLSAAITIAVVYYDLINYGPWVGISTGFGIITFWVVSLFAIFSIWIKDKFKL